MLLATSRFHRVLFCASFLQHLERDLEIKKHVPLCVSFVPDVIDAKWYLMESRSALVLSRCRDAETFARSRYMMVPRWFWKHYNQIFIHHQNSLFNWNIRKFLKHGSSINKRITETIINSPETFYYLNNGISALCENFKLNKDNRELIIERLQIVNGVQTIGAIGNISVQDHFSELNKIQVLVKLTAVKNASKEKGHRCFLVGCDIFWAHEHVFKQKSNTSSILCCA